MAVYCSRCGKQTRWTVWGVDDIHLCDDVRRRLARREKQVNAVVDILRTEGIGVNRAMRCAYTIVAKLNQLGVTDE